MGKRTVRVTWLEHRRRKSPRIVEELCRPFFTVKGVFRVHLGDISVSGQQIGELFVSCRHISLVGVQAAGVFAEGLTSEECPHYFGCSVRKKRIPVVPATVQGVFVNGRRNFLQAKRGAAGSHTTIRETGES